MGVTIDYFQIAGILHDLKESLKRTARYSIALCPRFVRWNIPNLSDPNALVLIQLLIHLVTLSVVNVTADIKDFRLISLDTSRVSREEVCLPSVYMVNCQSSWKSDLGKILWRCFSVYCLDSSPQFVSVWLVVKRLHELSPCVSPMFVCCSCDLVVHLLQGGRCGISRSGVILCSDIFPYFRCDPLCIKTVSSRGYTFMVWYWFQIDITHDLFSFSKWVGSRVAPSLSSYLLTISVPVFLLRLKLVRWDIGLIVTYICNLMSIGRWSGSKFVFVCQLV